MEGRGGGRSTMRSAIPRGHSGTGVAAKSMAADRRPAPACNADGTEAASFPAGRFGSGAWRRRWLHGRVPWLLNRVQFETRSTNLPMSRPRNKVPFSPFVFSNDGVGPFGPNERFGSGVAVVKVGSGVAVVKVASDR